MKITKYGSFQLLVKIWNIKLVSDLDKNIFTICYHNTSLKISMEDADKILILADDLSKNSKYKDTVSVLCAKYLNRRGYI